jgi:replicative DNA helicase
METALGWFRQCDRLALLDGRHTADSVLATAARLRDKGRCDILYIDQMSRLDHQQQARETKEQAWTRTSNRLARGWQELGIPVVLLAQLNVKSGEEHPTPSAAHVKDCGSIVEDACWALLLDRPEGDQERFSRMKPEHQDKLRGKVLVSCVKDRGSNMGGTWQEALPIDRVSGYLGPLREAPTVGDAAAEEWARRGAQP